MKNVLCDVGILVPVLDEEEKARDYSIYFKIKLKV
jgi:hypothetical protein